MAPMMVAAGPTVGMIVAVGSARFCRNGVLQVAVFVLVTCEILMVYAVNFKVRSALVVVVVTLAGVTVFVLVTVVDGLVTVLGSRTVVEVSVLVLVAVTTGVETKVAVAVGVYVIVDWGPTDSLKSRSNATGFVSSPLLLMMTIDQSPELS